MQRTKKTALAGVLAATVMTVATPMTAANAGTTGAIHGGCGFVVTGGGNQGVIYDVSVTTSNGTVPNLVGAWVHCWIDVNGVPQLGTDLFANGPGVEAGATGIQFTAFDTDIVTECEAVDYGPTGTFTTPNCSAATEIQFPPQSVIDLVNGLKSEFLDPSLCPILKSLAGNYGPLTIDNTGDVSLLNPLAGEDALYDCPPYFVPPPPSLLGTILTTRFNVP